MNERNKNKVRELKKIKNNLNTRNYNGHTGYE